MTWQQSPRLTRPRGLAAGHRLACAAESGGVFSHRVARCLGHLRGRFCCRNTEWDWGVWWLSPASWGLPCCRVVLGGQWSQLATRLLGSKQPAPPSTWVSNPACAVRDPFEKGLNASENITAAVTLLHSYIEKPFCKVVPGEAFTCCLYVKKHHLCCGPCKFILSTFLLLSSQIIFS